MKRQNELQGQKEQRGIVAVLASGKAEDYKSLEAE
jgi:hypothetical protein